MNERIIKLAYEAGMRSPDLFKLTVSHMSIETLEKFAELIVRECADVADTEKPNYVGCGYITKTQGILIKEHFGFE